MSAVVALILMALVAGVVALGRAIARAGPRWLRPAHAPLWLVAGLVVALAAAGARLVSPEPAEALGAALRVAADGPGARVTHLALALASLIMMGLVSRIAFAILRRRRLDRAPVPAGFRVFGVGPDGRELRSLRARLFVPALVLALAVAGAGAFIARGDTTLWAGLVALLTSGALAVAPWPRVRAAAPAAAEPVSEPGHEAPDPLPALLAGLQRDGVPVRAEHRAAIAGPARLPGRVVAAARAGDTIVEAPLGAGKTGAGLEVVRADALEGRDALWVHARPDAGDDAIARYTSAPEAVFLPRLHALAPVEVERLAADRHAHARFDRVVVDDVDLLTGHELAALARDLATLAPDARRLVLGVGPEVVAAGRLLTRGDAHIVKPLSHEPIPSAEVRRWIVDRLPTPTPDLPRVVLRVLGPADAHRWLEAAPRHPAPARELLVLSERAARLRALAPACPRPLVPAHTGPPAARADALPPAAGTPVRTTQIRVGRVAAKARHRFRGPLELELWDARVELRRATGGERAHGPDQRRAHTRLAEGPEAPPVVVDARLVVLPTADPVVLHTLTHVARDLLPWFFRDADRLLGVTSARPSELGLAQGALVVHDLAPDGRGAGAVAAIAERAWQDLLEAARALLAGCDCAASCARCCESTRCTLTPHNVDLDRHRALAVLDGLLVPAVGPQARKVA